MTKRGRPRDPDVDERIRQATVDLLVARGFGGMSVDDVAAHAGVGKATIYRRWTSKDELVYDALSSVLDVEVPNPDTGTFEGDLRRVHRDMAEFLGSARGGALLRMAVTETARDPRIGRLYRRTVEARIAQARTTFARAVERGEIRPDADPSDVVEAMLGSFLLRVLIDVPLPSARPTELPAMLRLVLDGIRVH